MARPAGSEQPFFKSWEKGVFVLSILGFHHPQLTQKAEGWYLGGGRKENEAGTPKAGGEAKGIPHPII